MVMTLDYNGNGMDDYNGNAKGASERVWQQGTNTESEKMKSDIKANFVQLIEQQNSAEAVSWSQAEKWEYVIQEELGTLENRKTQ